MKRAQVIALIDRAMKPEEGRRVLVAKRGGPIRTAALNQRIIDPREASRRVLDALAAAGLLDMEKVGE